MSGASFKSDLMFGELLAYLRQHGFQIGVDHYLRLQKLLERVGAHCAPHELRTLLCPIFATNKTQQEQFYSAFDSYFDIFKITDEQKEAETEEAETALLTQARTRNSLRRRWLYVATPLAVIALVIAFVLLRPQPAEQSATNQANANISPDVSTDTSESATTVETAPEIVGGTEPAQIEKATQTAPTPQAMPPAQSFYERNQTAIHIAILLLPLLLFLLYEWYRFARRKLLIEKQQTRKPPFVWPIHVDAPEDSLYDAEQLLTAARLMRRRQVDEFRRLDVEATVSATIERLGFPEFRYKSDSRVPEYLVLIDRASFRDHQARAFDELTQALEGEGVFVVRYFFDADPRVCRDATGAGVVQLAELQNRFSTHRLLIFGNGAQLLDPITGRLDGWTAIFNHWQDRALLTVEPPSQWSLREIALAQSFIVLPATLDGLLALIDHFETTVPADLRSWARGRGGQRWTDAPPEEAIPALRQNLGENTFQWLAACAVYTELQWNLTLHIGSLRVMPPGLLTESNLLKLIRLPWFRTGAIPDELRWHLINQLTPERQTAVRAALVDLLERDPAPPETVASEQYRLNLFAQRWLQSQTRKRLRELMKVIKELPRGQVARDLTLLRFLESSRRSPLDFILPDRLRKLFYNRGVPAFGLKTGARLLVTLLFIGLAWVGIKALAPKADERTLLAGNFESAENVLPEQAPSNSQTSAPVQETPAAPDNVSQSNAQPESQTQNQPSQTNTNIAEPLEPPERGGEGIIESVANANVGQPGAAAQPTSTNESSASKPAATVADGRNEPKPVPTASTSSTTNNSATSAPSPSPIASAPTPTPPPVSIVSGGVLNGRAISLPKPAYPPAAIEAGVSGTVVVEVTVDESGNVIYAKAIKGHKLLEKAAAQAALKARFPPPVALGQPVKLKGVLNYNFKLAEPSDMRQQPRIVPGGRLPGRPGGRPPED